MDLKFLWNRIKFLILDPDKAWHLICTEHKPARFVRDSFFFPLVLLASIMAFLGSLLFTNTGVSEIYSILTGIKYFVLYSAVIVGTSYIIFRITGSLNLNNDFLTSFKIIVYSAAPFLICQIISRLFESFIFINILALYGLYIFWLGSERMLNPPEKLKTPLLFAAASIFIVLFIFTDWLLTMIIDRLYFAFFA